MNLKLPIVVAALVAGIAQTGVAVLPAALPEFKSREELRQSAAVPQAISNPAQPEAFYTGRPYESTGDGYLFKYRNFDSELSRWTSFDPTGFPDGCNNYRYVSDPVAMLDCLGAFSLSITTPSVSEIADSITGEHRAVAWNLIHVPAGAGAAGILQSLIGVSSTLSTTNLPGDVAVSNFYVQNHSSAQSGNNPNVAAVNLTLQFLDAPSGFGWIQMQRVRLGGQTSFSNWQLDISSGAGPQYSAGPILTDTPAVGQFPKGDGERQLYTFAAIKNGSEWTIYDGIYWGGEVYE